MSERNDGMIVLTCAEYAAIELRVPQSGTPWLDAMITEARRMDYAGLSLASLSVNAANKSLERGDFDERAIEAGEIAGEFADAVMTAITTMIAASTPKAEPASEWPAMPDGLPPLPEGYVYVGRGAKATGARYVLWGEADKCWMNPISPFGCIAGCPDLHYAVHASDLHKVKRGAS